MKDKQLRFKQLYEEHKDRIYRMCCSYESGSDARKDMFQDVMTNIWRSLDSFRGDAAVGTWIFRITVNTCLGSANKSNKKKKLHVDVPDHELQQVNDGGDLARTQEVANDIQFLYTCLNRLPAIEQTIMSLLLEGLNNRQIADVCGLTEGNVRVKIHRSKKNLKQLMEVN